MKTYDVKNGVIEKTKKDVVKNDNWTRFDRRPRVITVNGKEAILL